MQWFGEKSWEAPVCKEDKRIDIPVGEPCDYCDVPIAEGDLGVRLPFVGDPSGRGYVNAHKACMVRAILPSRSRRKS